MLTGGRLFCASRVFSSSSEACETRRMVPPSSSGIARGAVSSPLNAADWKFLRDSRQSSLSVVASSSLLTKHAPSTPQN